QIVAAILDEHLAGNAVFAAAFSYEDRLLHRYPARSYCLQYRESDLAFIERLLAEEGISYRFGFAEAEATTPHHTLILFDDTSDLDGCSQPVIRFHRADGTEAADTWPECKEYGSARLRYFRCRTSATAYRVCDAAGRMAIRRYDSDRYVRQADAKSDLH
ncbi:hypothetical protein E4K72_16250, partial [Oxalobacteraceae bacterium OM1]